MADLTEMILLLGLVSLVFFLLAGAALELEALPAVGWLGAAYVAARVTWFDHKFSK